MHPRIPRQGNYIFAGGNIAASRSPLWRNIPGDLFSAHPSTMPDKIDNQEIENATGVGIHDEIPDKNLTNYNLVDKEVAKYATDGAIEIDEATDKRLKKMIDKRILVVMMITYLIQTIDKGGLAFSSIMGIKEDAHLQGNQVGSSRLHQSINCDRVADSQQYQWLTTIVYLAILCVEFPVCLPKQTRWPDTNGN